MKGITKDFEPLFKHGDFARISQRKRVQVATYTGTKHRAKVKPTDPLPPDQLPPAPINADQSFQLFVDAAKAHDWQLTYENYQIFCNTNNFSAYGPDEFNAMIQPIAIKQAIAQRKEKLAQAKAQVRKSK